MYKYSNIKDNLVILKKGIYTEDNKEECIQSHYIYKRIRESYPELKEVLERKINLKTKSSKDSKEIFLKLYSYFCKLAEPLCVSEYGSLINTEVNLVNQILRFEPNWYYSKDYSFFSPGDYSRDQVGNQSGKYSDVSFSLKSYEIGSNVHIDFDESSRFYIAHRTILEQLHKVILKKEALLSKVFSMENPENNMDIEVLKVIVCEMGVNYNYGALDFLVKHNKKTSIEKCIGEIKDKVKIKK